MHWLGGGFGKKDAGRKYHYSKSCKFHLKIEIYKIWSNDIVVMRRVVTYNARVCSVTWI